MNELQKIKEIIHKVAKEMNIEIDKIILFGSRARGDYREDSDYDLLIITKEKLEREKENGFYSKLQRELVFNLHKPIDLIIVSANTFFKYKKYKLLPFYWAEKEGIIA